MFRSDETPDEQVGMVSSKPAALINLGQKPGAFVSR